MVEFFSKWHLDNGRKAIVFLKIREVGRQRKLRFSGKGLNFPQKFLHIHLAQVIRVQSDPIKGHVPKVKLPTSRTWSG